MEMYYSWENNAKVLQNIYERIAIRYDGKVFGCEAFKYVQLFDDNGDIIYSDSIYEKNLVNQIIVPKNSSSQVL